MEKPFLSAWLLLGLSALATCAANLLLNQASLLTTNQRLVSTVASPWFAGAIGLYICDLILFTLALRSLPVSLAVPVVSGIRIVATAAFATILFREQFTFGHAIAAGLIAVGIAIMTRS
ncbi:MAG: SMR family transporter [Phormidesmis sp.]